MGEGRGHEVRMDLKKPKSIGVDTWRVGNKVNEEGRLVLYLSNTGKTVTPLTPDLSSMSVNLRLGLGVGPSKVWVGRRGSGSRTETVPTTQ